jgi:RNA polymerase sigma-70 factor (ECF subfamily)
MSETLTQAQLQQLEANRSRFVRFIASKVGDDAAAEDLLQSALMRAMNSPPEADGEDAVIGWFMAVLKNAITDHYRRKAVSAKTAEENAANTPEIADAELKGAVCGCVKGVVATLKPEFAEVLGAVELDEQEISAVAERLGITPNNVRVRLHRARTALKQELLNTCKSCASHGCLDCSCHGSKPTVTLTPR